MRKLILLLSLILCSAAAAMAQNRIDALVDRFAAVGDATFTSVIKRNPQTKKVEKVVKVLRLESVSCHKMIEAFRAERGSGTFTERREQDREILTLVTQNARQERIYTLIYNVSSPVGSKVTIIVNIKS